MFAIGIKYYIADNLLKWLQCAQFAKNLKTPLLINTIYTKFTSSMIKSIIYY